MRLVFASNNAHKLAEVRAIMPAGVEVLSLHDIGFEQEIAETGVTLEENSRIKAATVAAFIGERLEVRGERIDGIFADDTGREIDALDGQPGVYTARWYLLKGERLKVNGKRDAALTDEREVFAANRAKALRELEGKSNRGAQFRTVITLIRPSAISHQPSVEQVSGVVRGRIATEEYGQGGFGYDPIFIPDGYAKTFGELPSELKNTISHRARALENLKEKLRVENNK